MTFSGPDLLRSVTVLEEVVNCHWIFDRMQPVDSSGWGCKVTVHRQPLKKRCQMKKQQIEQVVADLPEDVDVDHLIEHLHLLDKLEKSEQQLARGEGISHEAAKQRLSQWLK